MICAFHYLVSSQPKEAASEEIYFQSKSERQLPQAWRKGLPVVAFTFFHTVLFWACPSLQTWRVTQHCEQ